MDVTAYKKNIPAAMGEFTDRLQAESPTGIHSVHIVGSVLTPDFQPERSDINSVVVLEKMELAFLDFLVPLGKTFGEKKIAAPLVMTPTYITRSMDVFPIEFLGFRDVHLTVFGEDLLAGLTVDVHQLRLQCEREAKSMLIGLRQGYLHALGDSERMTRLLIGSIKGFFPLFRALLRLNEQPPVLGRQEMLAVIQELDIVDTGIFTTVSALAREGGSIPEDPGELFGHYYTAAETLAEYIDALAN